jgi:hypothetical protein
VQHAFAAVIKDLDKNQSYDILFEALLRFYLHSDGAGSHFKSKYTVFALFKLLYGRHSIWEYGAAGHGKGPWDGLAAVIKTMLRKWEKNHQAYMPSAAEAFIELTQHYEKANRERLVADDGINEFVIWYITGPNDVNELPTGPRVLPPIPRPAPAHRPQLTALVGIQQKIFVCRPSIVTPGLMHTLHASHSCSACDLFDFDNCDLKDEDSEPKWGSQMMVEKPAIAGIGGGSNRSTVNAFWTARRKLAWSARVGDKIALQSAKDTLHKWWMAEVAEICYQHKGLNTTVDGFNFVKQGWYLKVFHYTRSPLTHANKFKRDPAFASRTIDAEGVIRVFKADDLNVVAAEPQAPVRRSGRGNAATQRVDRLRASANPTLRVKESELVNDVVAEAGRAPPGKVKKSS